MRGCTKSRWTPRRSHTDSDVLPASGAGGSARGRAPILTDREAPDASGVLHGLPAAADFCCDLGDRHYRARLLGDWVGQLGARVRARLTRHGLSAADPGERSRPQRGMSGRSRLLTGGVPYTPMPTLLTTERFILTPEELSDAPWLAELFTARGGAAVSEAQARERVAAMHQLTRTHGIGAYVLWPRDGGTPVGYAAIIVGRGTVEEPELAYELLPDAHGHGYATEAARAVLAAAFATSRRRVWATVRPWNAASLRVLDKLGGFHQVRTTSDDAGQLVWFACEGPAL